MRTKRVSRQLKKVFGDEAVESRLAAVGVGEVPGSSETAEAVRGVLANFPALLDTVEETYQQLEERANLAQKSMEVSATELTEANSRLFRMNQTFDAMVNSLGQGFVLFGPNGICEPVFSKACEDLLEARPAGRPIAEVLRVAPEKREAFTDWIEILFQDRLEFGEFARLGPALFPHSCGKRVVIEYKPVRGSGGQIDFIMAIATDHTKEFEASERAREMAAHVTLVTAILRDKDRFLQFVTQFRRLLDLCTDILIRNVISEREFAEARRHLHTLKGAAGSFGMLGIQTRVHSIEGEIAKRESLVDTLTYLRDELPNLRGLFEQALADNADVIGDISRPDEPQRKIKLATLLEFERLLATDACERQYLLERLRENLIAVPCACLFAKFDSVLQETASRLGKKLGRITVVGDDVRIVPERYQGFFLNLPHVFRNIVDHGIESPAERAAAGKSEAGHVTITIARKAENVEVRIRDDGRGVNIERVRQKLKTMGMADLAARGSREEILDAIFMPGLSTAESVTEISGRGVGMDAVRASLLEIGGRISVESVDGKGTSLLIRLPLRQEPEAAKSGYGEGDFGRRAS